MNFFFLNKIKLLITIQVLQNILKIFKKRKEKKMLSKII